MSERTMKTKKREKKTDKLMYDGVRARESKRPVSMCAHKQINNTSSYVASQTDEELCFYTATRLTRSPNYYVVNSWSA